MSQKAESALIGICSAVAFILIVLLVSSTRSKPASAIVNKTPDPPSQYAGRSGDGSYYYIQISTPDGAVNCIEDSQARRGYAAGISCNWEQFNAAHQAGTK